MKAINSVLIKAREIVRGRKIHRKLWINRFKHERRLIQSWIKTWEAMEKF